MDLRAEIKQELWDAIKHSYESANYKSAILEAMHFVTNMLRERAGVDGDGVALVGQALGGDTPRLRVNRLQTDTEKNTQKGFEALFRGLYQAVRNPRSHEQLTDDKPTADAIICFINYLVGIVEQSKSPFVLGEFIDRIFEPDFVPTDRYSRLLADEIPQGKRLECLIQLYRRRQEGDANKLPYIARAIIDKLSVEEVGEFIQVVSDDLKTVKNEGLLMRSLAMLPVELWIRVSEVSRLRVENKLIASIEKGYVDPITGEVTSGILGTWASDFLVYFSLKDQVRNTILEKLNSEDQLGEETAYVMRFFLRVFPQLVGGSQWKERYILALANIVRSYDQMAKEALKSKLLVLPITWREVLRVELQDFGGNDLDEYKAYFPELYDEEDIPF